MKPETPINFGPFRLNSSDGPLYCNDTELVLRPKTLAILWLLVSRSGEVISIEAAAAGTRYASREASQLLRHGLDLVAMNARGEELAPLELELLLALGPVPATLEGYGSDAVAAAYDRAHQLCSAETLASHRFVVLRSLASFYLLRADYATAREIGLEILQSASTSISTSKDDPPTAGQYLEGHMMCGSADYFSGRFSSAHHELQHTLNLYDPEKHSEHALIHGIEPGVLAMSWQAVIVWIQGEPVQDLRLADESLALAETVQYPFSLCQCIAAGTPWGEKKGICGANGQRPCQIVERIPSCNSGLAEDFVDHICVDDKLAMCLTITRAVWLAKNAEKGLTDVMKKIEEPVNAALQELVKVIPPDVQNTLDKGAETQSTPEMETYTKSKSDQLARQWWWHHTLAG